MRLPISHRNLAIAALAAMALVLPQAAVQAQQDTPSANTAANQGQDYAANELGNPWDMNSSSDIAYEYTRDNGQITNLRFEDGKLKGTTQGDSRVTLLVPSDPHVNPVLPEGGFIPIDTSKYRYLTVRMNVDRTAYANVYWQAGSGTTFNGWVETSGQNFKTFSPGDNVITFDMATSKAWTGTVQGLYFDPHASTGVSFEIDYVRLSTQTPETPDNNIPQIAITAPSYISGPDFATTQLGNPWNMNSESDVERQYNLKDVSFSNGIMRATNTSNDPSIALNVPSTINTQKYHYLTYRMSVDGAIDTVQGSVARFLWYVIPETGTTTNDIVVYEGFHTVSFDLNTILTESNAGSNTPWAQSAPQIFRLDPHEFPNERAFNLDYVMLTGDSTANQSYTIRYTASDGDGSTPNISIAYDTDRDPGNGTTAISCGSTQLRAGNQNVYLPLITGGEAPPVTPSGTSCSWNTSQVPNGTYYIYITANDGTDTVGRYSQTPVIVQH